MDFRSFQEIQKIRKKRQKPEQKSIQKINRKKSEKHAKIMQKSDATPGSLQNPVSDQFWDHFGRVPGAKSTQNRTKGFPKRMRKNSRFLACEKNTKSGPPRGQGASPAACAAPTGRFGGVQYTAKVCKNLEIMQWILKRLYAEFIIAFSTPAGAADIQTLRAFRRARLDAKMYGELVAWMPWKC
jgi:hypothetical protein